MSAGMKNPKLILAVFALAALGPSVAGAEEDINRACINEISLLCPGRPQLKSTISCLRSFPESLMSECLLALGLPRPHHDVILGAAYLPSSVGSRPPLVGSKPSAVASKPSSDPQAAAESIDGLDVKGSPEFIAATNDALVILRRAGYSGEIKSFIKAIFQAPSSGVYVQSKAFGVGDPTWRAGVRWYAGVIAHESRHSRLYEEARSSLDVAALARSSDRWSGAEAEKKCLAFQLTVLQAIGAEEWVLSRVSEDMKGPTYQNIPEKARNW